MRISELSHASGVSVATLKFYLREGLLPRGDPVAPNQALYAERHLHRLRLIRAMTDIGGLSLREVRAVLKAVEDASVPVHQMLGTAQAALEPKVPPPNDARRLREARAIVDAVLTDLGWQVSADAPARQTLAHAVATLRGLGWSVTPDVLARYALAVDRLAKHEVGIRDEESDRERLVERMIVGTVVFEAVLAGFRRLAHEHHSAQRD